MALKEYKPGTAFSGVIGRTFDVSSPAWPEPLRAKEGAPNVLFIVQDDTGLRPDGLLWQPHRNAEHRPTRRRRPALQQHAHHGALFADALLHPDRAQPSLKRHVLHHRRFHRLSRRQREHPLRERDALRNAAPAWLQHLCHRQVAPDAGGSGISAAGPYDRWPLGRGFERYYGFLGGDTHQYYPELVYDNHTVEPEKTPEEGYHLTEDLTDKAISFIADSKQVAPNKPFFMYFCPGAGHAPHHVPKEWADKYKGKFDDGWDAYREKTFARQKELGIVPQDAELSRHDPDVQDWNTLSADEKKLYARMMEVFAGFLTHTDYHYGRLFNFLKTIGQWENTLIMFISDNGASAEGGPTGSVNENKFFNNVPDSLEENLKKIDELGGPTTFNHYAWGWAFAGNTPFRRWKRETYRGGISDPFIVHWPKGIKAKGEIRTQYAHAIDMVPTVLEALGHRGPDLHQGCDPVADRGPQLCPRAGRREGAH